MNELLKALAPAKRRLRLQRLLQGAGAGFASGALAALILLAVTAFVPLDGRRLIAAAAAAATVEITYDEEGNPIIPEGGLPEDPKAKKKREK